MKMKIGIVEFVLWKNKEIIQTKKRNLERRNVDKNVSLAVNIDRTEIKQSKLLLNISLITTTQIHGLVLMNISLLFIY